MPSGTPFRWSLGRGETHGCDCRARRFDKTHLTKCIRDSNGVIQKGCMFDQFSRACKAERVQSFSLPHKSSRPFARAHLRELRCMSASARKTHKGALEHTKKKTSPPSPRQQNPKWNPSDENKGSSTLSFRIVFVVWGNGRQPPTHQNNLIEGFCLAQATGVGNNNPSRF